MLDERDDNIFDLTKDMSSEAPPRDVKADSKQRTGRPSYIPKESKIPVVMSPIKVLREISVKSEGTVKSEVSAAEKTIDLTPPPEPTENEEIIDLEPHHELAEGDEDEIIDLKPPVQETAATVSDQEILQDKSLNENADELDFGTPEAVFDTLFEEQDEKRDSKVTEKEIENESARVSLKEEEEEIDLSDAEEMTEKDGAQIAFTDAQPAQSVRRPKMRRRRKRTKEWWEDIFDDDYLALLPKNTERDLRREVDAVEQGLKASKGSLILDLACGDGRHAVAMAQRGYRMVGVDLSLPMLARAGEAAQEVNQTINFIHGDMRDLGFEKTFDGVYCIGTSFGYFDDQTNYKVLEGIARALKQGASFFLEVANRDYALSQQPNLTWFQGNGSVCMEETSINYLNSRLKVIRQLIMGENVRQIQHEISMRLYSLHELGVMLTSAGFAVSRISGNPAAPGAFFGVDSPLIIISASRRK